MLQMVKGLASQHCSMQRHTLTMLAGVAGADQLSPLLTSSP